MRRCFGEFQGLPPYDATSVTKQRLFYVSYMVWALLFIAGLISFAVYDNAHPNTSVTADQQFTTLPLIKTCIIVYYQYGIDDYASDLQIDTENSEFYLSFANKSFNQFRLSDWHVVPVYDNLGSGLRACVDWDFAAWNASYEVAENADTAKIVLFWSFVQGRKFTGRFDSDFYYHSVICPEGREPCSMGGASTVVDIVFTKSTSVDRNGNTNNTFLTTLNVQANLETPSVPCSSIGDPTDSGSCTTGTFLAFIRVADLKVIKTVSETRWGLATRIITSAGSLNSIIGLVVMLTGSLVITRCIFRRQSKTYFIDHTTREAVLHILREHGVPFQSIQMVQQSQPVILPAP